MAPRSDSEFELRSFVNNPNPPATFKRADTPAGGGAPAAAAEPPTIPIPAPQSPMEPATASLPVGEAKAEEAAEAEGTFWVRDDEGDKKTIVHTDKDGNDEELGTTKLNWEDIKKFGRPDVFGNIIVPKDTAASLAAQKAGVWDGIVKHYHSGEAGLVRAAYGREWLHGKMTKEEALSKGELERLKMLEVERPDLLWGEAPFGRFAQELNWAAFAAADLLPSTKEAIKANLKAQGLVGAIGAPIVVGGTAALAGPVATLPAVGAMLGAGGAVLATAMQTAGGAAVFKYAMDSESGGFALDMLGKGVSEQTVRDIAPVVGAVNGVLEMVSFRLLTAPAKRAFAKTVLGSDAVKKAMASWVSNYAKETGGEVAVEVAQEKVNQLANNLAAQIEAKPELLLSKEQMNDALLKTALQTLAGMAVIKLPGAALDYAGSRRTKAAAARVAEDVQSVKTMTTEQLEKVIGPEIDATKINEILANENTRINPEAAAKKIAKDDGMKAALHTRAEALTLKKDAILDGKDFAELTDAEQTEVLSISQEIENVNAVGKAIEVVAAKMEKPKKETALSLLLARTKGVSVEEKTGRRGPAPWELTKAEFSRRFVTHGTSAEAAEKIKIEGLKSGWASAPVPWVKNDKGKIVPMAIAHQFGDKILGFARKDIADEELFIIREGARPVWVVEAGETEHSQIVEWALATGKSVPREVLAEYPGLAEKYEKARGEAVTRQYDETEAVLRTLDKDTVALETELGLLGKEVEARAQAGKPTAALAAKLEKLAAQINENRARAAEIIGAPIGADESIFGGLEATIPAERLIRMEKDLAEGVARAKAIAAKHGAAAAKREVKNVQSYLLGLLKGARLTDADREAFTGAIKNIQTVEQMEKALPEFTARIRAAEETRRAKVMESVLKKGLKAGKAKTVSGKMTGKFGDPATQAIVDAVARVVKMTRKDAELELVAAEKDMIDAAASMGSPDYSPEAHALAEYRFRAAMYRAGQLLGKDSAEFVADVRAMMDGARAKFLEKREAEREALNKKKEEIISEVLGGRELPVDWSKREIEPGELAEGLRIPRSFLGVNVAAIMDLQTWARFLARLSGKKTGTSTIEKVFSTVEAANKAKGIKTRWEQKLRDAAENSYGINKIKGWWKRAWALRKLDDRLTERHDLGMVEDAEGKKYSLNFSIDEVIKRWMEKQDPTLAENFSDPRALGYTAEMEQKIFGLMTPEDIAFAEAQLELYRAFYREMNAVYSRVHGINLPFNPLYSPIKVLGYEQKDQNTISHDSSADQIHPKSTAPGSTIRRQKHHHPLAQQSSRSAFINHVFAASHYIAFEEKVRLWNAILADKKLRAAIVGLYGAEAFHSATAMVDTITANQFGRAIMRGVDRMITRLAVAKIIAKPIGAVKQMTTAVSFAEPVPWADQHLWYAELGKLLAGGKKALPKAWLESDFVTSREFDQTPELSAREEYEKRVRGGRTTSKTKWGRGMQYISNALHRPSIVDKLGIFLQLGDRASIVYAGGALFNYYKSKGMSTEEAIRRTTEVAATSQSYGHVSSLALLQQQKGAWRMLTFFTNQPIQHQRKIVGALSDLAAKGRISKKDALKTIIYYQFIMPMLFQAVVDWGWDDENQLRAAVFGPFNAYPALGEALWNLYEKYFYEDGKPMSNRSVWAGMVKDVEKAMDEIMEAEDFSDFARAIALLADPILSATYGVPTKPFVNMAEAGAAMEEEEYERAAKLAVGFSPYMVGEQEERE